LRKGHLSVNEKQNDKNLIHNGATQHLLEVLVCCKNEICSQHLFTPESHTSLLLPTAEHHCGCFFVSWLFISI